MNHNNNEGEGGEHDDDDDEESCVEMVAPTMITVNEEEEVVDMRTHLCKDIERNDPVLTTVDLEDRFYKWGYGYDLGCALLCNTHIQSIENLRISAFLFAATNNNATTTDQSIHRPSRGGIKRAAPFVKFLQESKSLRRLHLSGSLSLDNHSEEIRQEFLRQIAQAVAHNARIEEVHLGWYVYVDPENLAGFFASSIKSFSTRIHDFGGADSMDLVLRACRSNRTLETLTLTHDEDSPASDSVAAVVSALVGHPPIRVLTVRKNGPYRDHYRPLVAALASFASGTPSLEHLALKGYEFYFYWEQIMLLLDRLSVHRLSLLDCTFDPASFQKIVSYVRTSRTLKELALSRANYQVLACSFIPAYKDLLIGCSLQVLDLSSAWVVDVHELVVAWRTLTENILLPNLHLGDISQQAWSYRGTGRERSTWRELSFLLPKLIYLRELRTLSTPTGTEVKDFIDNIKQNGSLQKVCLGSFKDKMLESVCSRNRILGWLLEQHGTLQDVGSRHLDNMKYHQSLFPLLLRSASKIQRMGPHFIFGLLSMNTSVGVAENDGKRLTAMS